MTAGAARRQAGFGLLDVIATLAIMAIMIGIAAPNVARVIESVRAKAEMDELERSIARLKHQAFVDQRALSLPTAFGDAAAAPFVNAYVDQGWSFSGGPVVFFPTGMCSEGEIVATSPREQIRRFSIKAPECSPIDSTTRRR